MSAFLNLFSGTRQPTPPVWFMRQAGRYLPEYKEVRERCGSFFNLCYSPQDAAEVTLQPLRRFDLDGAIIFSDILTVPDALGQSARIIESKGPQLDSLTLADFQDKLSLDKLPQKLAPVYAAISLVREKLPQGKALLGFSGAPWTLALYMLEGEGSRDFAKAKEAAFSNEEEFSALLTLLTEALTTHLTAQIEAGAQALQIFDTWAGHCPAPYFEKWVISPTQTIVQNVRKKHPDIPLIAFPKGVGANLIPYAQRTHVSAISLDASTPLTWAVKALPSSLILQGNLDPLLLVAGGESLHTGIKKIHEQMQGRPYIFNLGHGIVPQTPPQHVEECVRWVQELS